MRQRGTGADNGAAALTVASAPRRLTWFEEPSDRIGGMKLHAQSLDFNREAIFFLIPGIIA
jgi:hypothetical protein